MCIVTIKKLLKECKVSFREICNDSFCNPMCFFFPKIMLKAVKPVVNYNKDFLYQHSYYNTLSYIPKLVKNLNCMYFIVVYGIEWTLCGLI